MRVISWNINSLRLRLPLLQRLVDETAPDIVCLQETKCPDDQVPHAALEAMGFTHRALTGMKSYNGVAILSRHPFHSYGVHHRVGREDCRHIEAVFAVNGRKTILHNLYIPAGGDIPDRALNDKFAHKLDFVAEMAQWFTHHHCADERMIAVGDFNIAPYEHDVWSHKQLLDVVSHTPIEVAHLATMRESLQWCDVARHVTPLNEKLYSWWSYRNRDWKISNRGRRLDHIWVTPPLVTHIGGFSILRDVRDWPQPSDHVPVILDITL